MATTLIFFLAVNRRRSFATKLKYREKVSAGRIKAKEEVDPLNQVVYFEKSTHKNRSSQLPESRLTKFCPVAIIYLSNLWANLKNGCKIELSFSAAW